MVCNPNAVFDEIGDCIDKQAMHAVCCLRKRVAEAL